MDGEQSFFRFESPAPQPDGKNSPSMVSGLRDGGLPVWADRLGDLLALAERTPGWNNRTSPPQYATLVGGCQLAVVRRFHSRSGFGRLVEDVAKNAGRKSRNGESRGIPGNLGESLASPGDARVMHESSTAHACGGWLTSKDNHEQTFRFFFGTQT
jgi:hypothetical protein